MHQTKYVIRNHLFDFEKGQKLYAHLARPCVVKAIFTRSAPAVGDPYQDSDLDIALVGEQSP
jgi:hypothetical protein